MEHKQISPSATNRILVKLRPTGSLQIAESRANLRPLYNAPHAADSFGTGVAPQWFTAELPDAAATPWDLAHERVASQLGIADESIIFVEPDLTFGFSDPNEQPNERSLAVGENCGPFPPDAAGGKVLGPKTFAWHLGEDFSQLTQAHEAVAFSEPRTRIAHLDTGYYRAHETVPQRVLHELERNFVRGGDSGSAEDPDNWVFPIDSSGHGTGTLSILAGGRVAAYGDQILGGAPEAEIVPLRIADSVVLLGTSTFAQAVRYATQQRCDVLTMSMGGLPSRVWKEAIDEAYLAGVCLVAAAGNNVSANPTRFIVYPARYDRVIAVCGVMANQQPYSGLAVPTMEGNYGPGSIMNTAMAAYTPNIPWAKFGCPDVVRLDGQGTSAATPQVAAAAALWLEKYKQELPRDWRRVEAVRWALFSTAEKRHAEELGQGILRASNALNVKPFLNRPPSPENDDSFAFLRVITGLGIVVPTPREQMFNLEFMQRWLLNTNLQVIVPDPEGAEPFELREIKRLMEAIIEDRGASQALRKHVEARYPAAAGAPRSRQPSGAAAVKHTPILETAPLLPDPPYRRLRVYAMDPSFSGRLDTADVSEATLHVRWEALEPGPKGEYFAIEDIDDRGVLYLPVDLNEPSLLAQDGWAPSEGNVQFHQQMVYAVAMRTVEHFENALGRPVLWRPRPQKDEHDDSVFVRQLHIQPHALEQANAFYSPLAVGLKFGYFEAPVGSPGGPPPGSSVFTCLSHDIVAHETTHAVLDGMHRRFNEASNPDVLAFHEAFADVVALLQHFTMPEILERELGRARGDLEAETTLGSLAVQFGQALSGRGALREAIGHVEGGVWKRLAPDPAELQRKLTPHARGAVLVAAIFDAFIAIYKRRVADLFRIHTAGSGILPAGAIQPDLVRRLTDEAVKSATHVLTMCIRALDYLPPVDVTFFEYLRALITADFDLVKDDRYNYRVAFVEAFRQWGIYPAGLASQTPDAPRTLSTDTLRWRGLDLSTFTQEVREKVEGSFTALISSLKQYADACLYLQDRQQLFELTRQQRITLHDQLESAFEAVPAFATQLGLETDRTFEVHELRQATRVGPDGKYIAQVVVVVTQSKAVAEDKETGTPAHTFRGGSSLVIDLSIPEIKYCIVKNANSAGRQERTAAFLSETAADPLRALFVTSMWREPFAALHALNDNVVEQTSEQPKGTK